jgi:hypothetical protein
VRSAQRLARKDATLRDTFGIEQAAVDVAGFGRQLVEVDKAPFADQIAGVVDHGRDAQGAATFEVLLDPGVLVVGVYGDPHGPAGVDAGLVGRLHLRSSPSAWVSDEGDLDVVGRDGHPALEEHLGAVGMPTA